MNAIGREPGRFAPVVDIGDGGPPGAQDGRRGRQFDAGLARPRPVLEGGTRRRIGGHGAVDRNPRGLAHLCKEGILDRLLAGRQDQFEIGAVVHVCPHGPGRAVDGLDRGQADRQGQAEEVEVGVVVTPATVAEDAEGKAPPRLGMDGAVEEGAAR